MLCLLGGGGFVVWHRVLLTRLLTHPQQPITDVEWYTPQERIAGDLRRPLPTAAVTEQVIPEPVLTAVAEYAETHNSAALLVMHRGKLVLERYWQGRDRTSTTNSQSLSKTVLALLIGIAIEEGHIQSEKDPVSRYLPEWAEDSRGQITIHDLLFMQSGLRNDRNVTTPFSDLLQMYGGPDAAAVALRVPAEYPPGERFAYNNVNSQLLGLILERATGERYTDYLSSQLWQPLGAQTASLWLDREAGNAKPFCCMFARPRDWARVGQLMMDGGRVGERQVVPEAWVEKLRSPAPLFDAYGGHLWLRFHSYRSKAGPLASDLFYLDGLGRQVVYVVPSAELVIVRVGENSPEWDDAALTNGLLRSLQTGQSQTSERDSSCLGVGGFYATCTSLEP